MRDEQVGGLHRVKPCRVMQRRHVPDIRRVHICPETQEPTTQPGEVSPGREVQERLTMCARYSQIWFLSRWSAAISGGRRPLRA